MAKDVLYGILGRGPFARSRSFVVALRHSNFQLVCLTHQSPRILLLRALLHLSRLLSVPSFLGLIKLRVVRSLCENDCMHAENWPFLLAAWEELFALDCAGYDVAHDRIFLRQVSSKVHLLPTLKHQHSDEKFYHLYFFLKERRGKPKSEPIEFPLTK